MRRHDTPCDVAIALARHAPRCIRALLDPAVGVGNLIAPLVSRLKKCRSKVYCVDSDHAAIHSVSENYRNLLPPSARFIHVDFLSWSTKPRSARFDCIVMNPPFAGSKNQLYPLERHGIACGTTKSIRHVPLEAAFMRRAIDLLKPKGRLLAIVPCSVVMAEGLQWFREELFSRGAIRFVHELPPRSFPGVDSRMYLLVFDKGVRQRQITLLNHDLHEPERLKLSLTDIRTARLDFGYVNATIKLTQLQKNSWLCWKRLRDVADVLRGDAKSPEGPRVAVHPTDYRDGFWRSSSRHRYSPIKRSEHTVRRGDILIARVGRNASRIVGGAVGILGMPCSDCVIIVRPKKRNNALKIHFALRVILALEWAKPLVERGTGASYISQSSLLELSLPLDAWKRYPKLFQEFTDSQKAKAGKGARTAVHTVAARISRLIK